MKQNWRLITKLLPLAALVLVFLVSIPLTLAASGAWNVDSDGNWNDDGNWDAVPYPNGAAETATFGGAINAARVITIDGVAITISQVIFDNANSYTIAGANGGNLAFANTGSGVISVTNTNGNGAHTIALPVVLSRNLTVDVTTGTTLTISGSLNQGGTTRSVIKSGAGTLVLTTFNSYAGSTDVTSGTLVIGNNNAVGSGPLVPRSNSTVRAEAGPRILGNPLELRYQNFIFEGASLNFTNTATIPAGSSPRIIVNNITSLNRVSDPANSRNLRVTGSGTLNLNLSTTYHVGAWLRNEYDSNATLNLYARGTIGRVIYGGSGGTLAPGDTLDVATGVVTTATDTVDVAGEIVLHPDTILNIDLNGPAAGANYDNLTFRNNASGGCNCVQLNDAALQVDLGFTPAPGDTFTIISRAGGAGLVYGNFKDLPQGSVFTSNGVQLLINYMPIENPTEVILTRVDVPSAPGIAATGGSGQSAHIDADFALPLQATVTDQNGDPVPNALVTFSAPASGASAAFPDGNQRLTDINGVVTVTVRANDIAGNYNVTANLSPEQVTPATFALTNTAPALSVDDPAALESAGVMTFTVTLSEPTSLDVTVGYATTDGTAFDGVDYVGASGRLTVTAGLTEAIIPIAVISNSVVEGSRTFTVTLSNPGHAVISKNQGVGTILDDDFAPAPETKTYLPFISKN